MGNQAQPRPCMVIRAAIQARRNGSESVWKQPDRGNEATIPCLL